MTCCGDEPTARGGPWGPAWVSRLGVAVTAGVAAATAGMGASRRLAPAAGLATAAG